MSSCYGLLCIMLYDVYIYIYIYREREREREREGERYHMTHVIANEAVPTSLRQIVKGKLRLRMLALRIKRVT